MDYPEVNHIIIMKSHSSKEEAEKNAEYFVTK